MADAILTLNAGSSSIKFALFTARDDLPRIAEGKIEGVGTAPHLLARAGSEAPTERHWPSGAALTHEDLLGELLSWVEHHLDDDDLKAVGHRIVHGGREHWRPAIIDPALIARLDRLCPLAPLHQPHNLAAVRAVMKSHPDLTQVACFDTAFHRGHEPRTDRFGLPRTWEQEGVMRYGFHGLSYEHITHRMSELDPALLAGRMIVAHLGNGASLCAIRNGRSIDTTMGFTALDGLVMGTRCGALDPGVILYLMQSHGMDAAALEDLLYRRSGLLGVSGISSDMRVLLASADPRAQEAIDLFVFRIIREIGALAASMGGIDGLVFTGGIGEHAAPVREQVLEGLGWLGAVTDRAANARGIGIISAASSAIVAWVVPADEEHIIARHTRDLVMAA